jgi:hypothetical protein
MTWPFKNKLLDNMSWFTRHILTFHFLLGFSLTIDAEAHQIDIRPRITKIVNKLKKDDYVHFGYAVGYGAVRETKNKYYRLYLKLKAKATNDELFLLTKSSSKNIVIYSFAALHSRGYENLKSIFINHVDDTTFYWTAGGCTGFIERVNWHMLRELKPGKNGIDKNYLTNQEYDMYCAKFKKEDPFFSYE